MPKYLSGRVKRTPQGSLTTDRYQFLGLEQTEPNIGDPPEFDPLPSGTQYQIVSFIERPGERFWVPVGGGIIPGSLTFRDEGLIVPRTNANPNLGINSITDVDFVGAAVSVLGYINPDGSAGTAITVTVSAPGENHGVIFNNDGEFATSPYFTFDNSIGIGSVGIGTSNPTQNLHVVGNVKLDKTIYGEDNQPGNPGDLLIKTATGGVRWIDNNSVETGAAGTFTQVQFHDATGLLGGAPNFVFDFTNNRIGIGSTQPDRLLDVLGESRFTGIATFVDDVVFEKNVSIAGTLTYEDVTNVDAIGIITARSGIDIDSAGLNVDAGISTFNDDVKFITNNGNNILFDKSLNKLTFGDDVQAMFGEGEDLKIYHSSDQSYIQDTGQGNLNLDTNGFSIKLTSDNSKTMLRAKKNQGVELYWNNSKRLETSGVGVTIFGKLDTTNLSVTGFSTFTNNIDANGDLDVDGIANLDDVDIDGDLDVDGHTELDDLNVSGITTLSGNAEFKGSLTTFEGTGTGAGNGGTPFAIWAKANNYLWFSDDTRILMGFSQTLEIKSSGSESIIRDTRAGVAGTLAIGADKLILRNKDGNEPYLEANDNGSVKLYHDFLPRFETSGLGVTVYGTGTDSTIDLSTNDNTVRGKIFADNSDNIGFKDKGGDWNVKCLDDAAVELYYNTTKRIETLVDGGKVTGNLEITEKVGIGTNNPVRPLHILDTDCRIRLEDAGFATDVELQNVSGDAVLTTNGASNLRLQTDNQERLRITSTGRVGIGTENPNAKLDVNVGSSVTAFNVEGTEGQLFSVTNNLSSGSIFAVNDISGTPSINVDADGTIQLAPFLANDKIGIGTTNPQSKLDVSGDTRLGDLFVTGISTFSGAVGIADSIFHVGDTDTQINFGTNEIKFDTAGNERVRIDSTGDLLPGDNEQQDLGGGTLRWNTLYVKDINASGGSIVVDNYETNNLKVSGLSTFVGFAEFQGSVSIAGTLTYEDVTNIDAIGIVTARSGIDITSGGLNVVGITTVDDLDVNGDLDVDGHTELDNVNISGITTVNDLDVNGDLDVDGHTELDNLNVAGVSTFNDDVDFIGVPVGSAQTSIQFHKGNGTNQNLDALRLYESTKLNVGAGATGGFVMQGNYNGAGPTYNSYILTRGDNFFIDGGQSTAIKIRTQFARDAIIANSDNGGSGTVELYHSSGGTATKRLETSGVGVTVYDQLDTTHLNVSGVSTFSDNVFVGTGATVGFGTTVFFATGSTGIRFAPEGGVISWAHGPTHGTNVTSFGYVLDSAFDYLDDVFWILDQSSRFQISSSGVIQLGSESGAGVWLRADSTSTRLYHSGHYTSLASDIRLETSGLGVTVYGTVDATQLNASGIITSTGADINGDLDVDGRSELDITNISETLNVSGISTFEDNVKILGALEIQSVAPTLVFNDTTGTPDYKIRKQDGNFIIMETTQTNDTEYRLSIRNGGLVDIPGDLNVDGNVSIGGTLTYEDVTNVDAIGLVTARNGIHVISQGIVVNGSSNNSASTNANDVVVGTINDVNTGISILGNASTGVGRIMFSDGVGSFNQGSIEYRHADDSMRFSTATQEDRLTLLGNGKVGIGTDDLLTKLDVLEQSTDTYGDGVARFRYIDTDDTGGGSPDLHFEAKFKPGHSYFKSFVSAGSTDFLIVDADNNSNRPSFAVEGAGGTNKILTAMSAGNIGIGSANPAYTLDFGESSSTIRLVSENDGTAIRVGSGGGANDVTLLRVDGATPNHDGESNDGANGFSIKYMGSRTNNDNSLSIFGDQGTGSPQVEAVTILQDGKVGIASAIPAAKLDVRGDINFQNNMLISNNGGTSNIDHIWHDDNSNYGTGGTWNFVSDGTAKQVGNSSIQIGFLKSSGGGHLLGNVGVGTTSPYYKFQVNFNNANTSLSGGGGGNWGGNGIRIENDNTTTGAMALAHFRVHDADWHIGNKYVSANTSDFVFNHEGSEKLRIDSNGRFGFGTGSGIDERGHVQVSSGNCRIKLETGSTDVAGLVLQTSAIRFDVQAQNNFFQIYDNTASAERLRINSSGDFLPGGASQDLGSSTNKWDVVYANEFVGEINTIQENLVTGNLFVTGISTFVGVATFHTIGIGTDPSLFLADDLVVGDGQGSRGLTINSDGTTGRILFADGSTGDDRKRGEITYDHSSDSLNFYTNAFGTPRISIKQGGNVEIDRNLDVDGHTELDSLNVSGISTFEEARFADDKKLKFGNDIDLQIYHFSATNNNFISAANNADLTISAREVELMNQNHSSYYFKGAETGSIVYHNNAERLTTTSDGVIVTGIITASSANFIGNVSIGGTLTYEDVTNVDAIGLVTARNGIHVLANGIDVVGVSTFDDKVGIGNTVPNATLEVNGPIKTNAGSYTSPHPSGDTLSDAALVIPPNSGIYVEHPVSNLGRYTRNLIKNENAVIEIGTEGTGYINEVRVLPGTSGFFSVYNNADEAFRVDSNGRVGIGSENPAYTLDFGESASTIRLNGGGNGTAIRMGAGGSGNDFTLIRVDGATDDHDGESNDSNYGFSLKYMGSRTGNNNSFSLFADNSEGTQFEAITVLQDGKVGVKATSPSYELEVNGTVAATNFDSLSDRRYKTNIQVIENPIEKIMKIDGVSFNWKETNQPSLGVIADNVLEVLPEIVSGEDTKSVNYNGLIGLLIETVKDQQKQIDELRGLLDK